MTFNVMPALFTQNSGPAPGVWAPSSLPNLYAWYKSDGLGNTYSGVQLLTLADLSGNGHVGTAAGTPIAMVANAINGRSAVHTVTNTAQWVALGSSQGVMQNKPGLNLGVAGNFTYTGSNLGHLFACDTSTLNNGRVYIRYPHNTAQRPTILAKRLDTDATATLLAPTNATGLAVALFNLDYAHTSAEIRWNGATLASSSSFLTSGLSSNTPGNANALLFSLFNSGNSCQGDWGEIVLSDAPLSSTDAQKLEGYLAWQWGQQGSLPSGHPYKSAPP